MECMVYTLQSYNAFWGVGWVKVLKPSLTHYDKILGLFKEKWWKFQDMVTKKRLTANILVNWFWNVSTILLFKPQISNWIFCTFYLLFIFGWRHKLRSWRLLLAGQLSTTSMGNRVPLGVVTARTFFWNLLFLNITSNPPNFAKNYVTTTTTTTTK
jgi:hypothetical protein